MHKRRVNELSLNMVIEPVGPILIKSGLSGGADPTLPEMSFVRTIHPQTQQNTIYLPGASLKGAIRSHCERILNTVFGEDACCNPVSNKANCFQRVHDIKNTAEQYRQLCPACRIFGDMSHASHLYTADAYPIPQSTKLAVRQNVAIDRLSGGVANGPFDMEVALKGQFCTSLRIINFELWQIGLLALALRDMSQGRLRLGFAKSRGLGEVAVRITGLTIAYPGQFIDDPQRFEDTLYGVSALASDLREAYGYVEDDIYDLSQAGTLDDESLLWGQPTLYFGSSDQAADLDKTEQQQAHDEVNLVLRDAAQAWILYARARQGGMVE